MNGEIEQRMIYDWWLNCSSKQKDTYLCLSTVFKLFRMQPLKCSRWYHTSYISLHIILPCPRTTYCDIIPSHENDSKYVILQHSMFHLNLNIFHWSSLSLSFITLIFQTFTCTRHLFYHHSLQSIHITISYITIPYIHATLIIDRTLQPWADT